MLAQHAAAGLEVALDTVGSARPLGGGPDQAAFRILQEALTNAARHGMDNARVTLGFGDAAFEVVVTNRCHPATSTSTGGGHGLVGMGERASLLGGVLAAERAGGALSGSCPAPLRRSHPMTRVLIVDDDDLMDVRMPDLDGIGATRQLAAEAPTVKVLILTTFEQDDYVLGALRAGASGFLLKRTRPEDLVAAVHAIAGGDSLLSPSVTRRVIDRMVHQPNPSLGDQVALRGLTAREREVLGLAARNLSNREIGAARGRGVHGKDPCEADPDEARPA